MSIRTVVALAVDVELLIWSVFMRCLRFLSLLIVLSVTSPFCLADADFLSVWRVVGVASDDVLNVRAGVGTKHPIVGTLAYDARGVSVTSCVPHGVNSQRFWCFVRSHLGGVEGWVNQRFLEFDKTRTVLNDYDIRYHYLLDATEVSQTYASVHEFLVEQTRGGTEWFVNAREAKVYDISISKIAGKDPFQYHAITITEEGYADDSVMGEMKRIVLMRENEIWRVGAIGVREKCYRGAPTGVWRTGLCS